MHRKIVLKAGTVILPTAELLKQAVADLVAVSMILTDLAEASDLPQDVREAIREGIDPPPPYTPHRSCPCRRCHEYFGTMDR